MSFKSWLSSVFQPRRRPIRKTMRNTSRLLLEQLEDRTVPATFTVLNTLDSGAGSLREAIGLANTTAGADTIVFDGAVFGSTPQTITLTSGQLLLNSNAAVTITGPGAGLLSISGNNTSRVFFNNSAVAATAEVSGLTISRQAKGR